MPLARLDIAVSTDGLEAALPGFVATISVQARIDASGENGSASSLAQAFAKLDEAVAGALGVSPEGPRQRFLVRVALMPPLAEAKLVDLPALRPEEAQLVLRRDSARHFLAGNRPVVVGTAQFGQPRRGEQRSTPTFASAATRSLVDAIRMEIEALGWELDRVVPAHAAWIKTLDRTLRSRGSTNGTAINSPRVLVAVDGQTAHLIRIHGTGPDRIRRIPAGDVSAIVEAAGSEPGRAVVLADSGAGREIQGGLSGAGWAVTATPDATSARAAAARDVGDAEPELVPDFILQSRVRQNRGMAVRLLTIAIVIAAAAAAVHLWGTARAYRQIREERAELRAVVAPALAGRDSLERMTARLERLQAMEDSSARWTEAIVELATLLPEETHLVSLRAAGDTLVIQASGGRAGEALASIGSARTLSDVRLEGTIQRDIEEGMTSRERFTLSAIRVDPAQAHDRPSAGAR